MNRLALRRVAGVIVRDLPRYAAGLLAPGNAYLGVRNRNEAVEWAPDGSGVRCLWRWASDLHAPKVWPALGSRLARHAHARHPVQRRGEPAPGSQAPALSFLIGHRGAARLPHLLATLESIAGQEGACVECIVVEQDAQASLAGVLPGWVRHLHSPPPREGMPFCRSWAFNVGARVARGRVLVLHDNDLLVPRDYAREILRRVDAGAEVVNPKRFVFYLGQAHTEACFSGEAGILDQPPDVVVQNLEGGGSAAITAAAFAAIGGMDESFIGWGGEDTEFWERAETRQTWPYGGLPLWHLWHAAQPGKQEVQAGRVSPLARLAGLSPAERIALLKARPRGLDTGPVGAPTQEPRA